MGTHMRILKKYNRRCSKRYSKKSKRHTRKNIYSKTYKKIQKGGFFCGDVKAELARTKTALNLQTECCTELTKQLSNQIEEKTNNVKESPEYKKMYTLLTNVENTNKTLNSENKKLNNENFMLKMKLQEFTKQPLSTDDEINAVKLNEDDMENINTILEAAYHATDHSGFVGDSRISRDSYIKQNIENAKFEYRKNKLMRDVMRDGKSLI